MRFRPRLDADPSERSLWGPLMDLGLVFPLAILLGFLAGRWIGGHFGHRQAGQLIGLALGIATAFRELWKVTARLNRLEQEAMERQQREAQEHKDAAGKDPASPAASEPLRDSREKEKEEEGRD